MAQFIKVTKMLHTKKCASDKPSYFNTDNIIEFKESDDGEISYFKAKVSEIIVKTGNGTRAYTVKESVEEILAQTNNVINS